VRGPELHWGKVDLPNGYSVNVFLMYSEAARTTWVQVEDPKGNVVEDRSVTDQEIADGTIRLQSVVRTSGEATISAEWYEGDEMEATESSNPKVDNPAGYTSFRLHVRGDEG
jgi:hypothetical protein